MNYSSLQLDLKDFLVIILKLWIKVVDYLKSLPNSKKDIQCYILKRQYI